MSRRAPRDPGERRGLSSLGASAVLHGLVLGALALGGGLFVTEVTRTPRVLTLQAPSLADLVEEAAPAPLPPVGEPELDPREPAPFDPTRFRDTWVAAPDPAPDLPADEDLAPIPTDALAEQLLRERAPGWRPPRPLPPDVVALTPESAPVGEPAEDLGSSVEPTPSEDPGPPVGPTSSEDLAPPVEPPPAEDPAPPAEAAAATGPLPAPARLEGRDPDYPRTSVRRREQGDVTLRLELDPEGRVILVELAESSGARRLDEACMAVAPAWRFDLTDVSDEDRARGFLHTVRFRLTR